MNTRRPLSHHATPVRNTESITSSAESLTDEGKTKYQRHKPPSFSCWSCRHYTPILDMVPEMSLSECYLGRDGFPTIGSHCKAFSYEPGSDERERES